MTKANNSPVTEVLEINYDCAAMNFIRGIRHIRPILDKRTGQE